MSSYLAPCNKQWHLKESATTSLLPKGSQCAKLQGGKEKYPKKITSAKFHSALANSVTPFQWRHRTYNRRRKKKRIQSSKGKTDSVNLSPSNVSDFSIPLSFWVLTRLSIHRSVLKIDKRSISSLFFSFLFVFVLIRINFETHSNVNTMASNEIDITLKSTLSNFCEFFYYIFYWCLSYIVLLAACVNNYLFSCYNLKFCDFNVACENYSACVSRIAYASLAFS